MKNIVLVGFMGTGKSTIAKTLSEKSGMEYLSTDDLIIKKGGSEIVDIFKNKGEDYFRHLEKECVKKASLGTNTVIDAGGGVVLSAVNMENLRRTGLIVCLWAEPEDILKRTSKHGHRPLLNVEDPLAKIKELLEKRKPFYERADLHINTSAKSVDETVDAILRYHNEKK